MVKLSDRQLRKMIFTHLQVVMLQISRTNPIGKLKLVPRLCENSCHFQFSNAERVYICRFQFQEIRSIICRWWGLMNATHFISKCRSVAYAPPGSILRNVGPGFNCAIFKVEIEKKQVFLNVVLCVQLIRLSQQPINQQQPSGYQKFHSIGIFFKQILSFLWGLCLV